VKTLTLELPATPKDVMRGVERLQQFCREQQVPEKATHALMLGVEELASNIVNHAYECDATQSFRLTMQYLGDRFTVELRDHGPAFDPLQAAAPDLEEDPDERGIGGLGVHLARHFIEELNYARTGDENVLRLIKHLPPH
jgi:anti-sigma regulatory factor (Ser/Thr protein kinase)